MSVGEVGAGKTAAIHATSRELDRSGHEIMVFPDPPSGTAASSFRSWPPRLILAALAIFD
ncbi:hypothetical protein [Microbacterium candidum]|uniref:ATP-binding protein n=1 Tax=Microbacterium candidum TaxID=3041922 RepID=A0ABT7MW29_9MICO|nr:hypothetical protein [Microbacterium sp. ASV49]MDL9978647.1 hypothetical protein [Microbacterium sp. ASV49]